MLLLTVALTLYYNLAVKNKKSVGNYTASVNALIFSGNYSDAVSECSDGIRHYPQSADLYILKARAYLLSGDTAKALGTLDYGYKQTQSGEISEFREQIAEGLFIDDAEFLPLTESEISSEYPDGSSSDVSDGGESVTESYHSDEPIKVTIPDVLPPEPPEDNEASSGETNTGLNKTESE